MSIGPIAITASAAGSPLAQMKGEEAERAPAEVGAERRAVYYDERAAAAAGVGEPDGEDHAAAERDGDGRREWEAQPEPEGHAGPSGLRQSKDPTGQSGNLLDVTG